MARPRGRLVFIGRNSYGVPYAKIRWNDGEEEIRVGQSTTALWDEIGELVDDGIIADEDGYFA